MYTTKDVADLLKVTIRTVQNYLRDGLLPYSHRLPSGFYRFSDADMHMIREKFFRKDETDGRMV